MSQLPVVVYSPESQMRRPKQLVGNMFADLWASRELAWRLLVRNISAQYRQSLLGFFWAFLPPIFTTMVWVFLNSQNILNIGETDIPYPIYVLVGTLLWQGFVDALNSPIRATNEAKAMLAKINFPREALILAGLGEVLFGVAIRLTTLVPLYFWFRASIPWTLALAPLGIFSLVFLGLMLGILLTPLALLYSDIQRGLALATTVLFYFTPIVYNPPTEGLAALITRLNPVSPLLVTTREWMTTGVASNLGGFLFISVITLPLLFFGWVLYRIAMSHLIERMSA